MDLATLKFDPALLQKAKSSLVSFGKAVASFFVAKQADLKGKQALVGILLIVFGGHVYYWNKHSFWSRRNVKGPTPLPFFGNFLSFFTRPRQELELEWKRKYGKVYGYYMGVKPYLVVSDADILKQICVKDFDKFPNHFFVAVKNKYQKHFLIMQRDDQWRGLRSVMTPTFSSGKIKYMFNILQGCVDDLILAHHDRVKQVDGGQMKGTMNARAVMGAFSMGSALSSFYGVSLEREKSDEIDPEALTKDNFSKRSTEALTQSPLRFVATSLVPYKIMKFLDIPLIKEAPLKFFEDNAQRIIQRRLQSKRRHNDYLQLLIEARSDEAIERTENDDKETHHAYEIDAVTEDAAKALQNQPTKRMKLSQEQISVQTMMLMMVATETTATLLSNTIYLLSHHRDIQDKLREELLKIAVKIDENNNDQVSKYRFDYESMASCEYLDCVISESLRLMSPVIALDREASEDYYIEKYDIHIPKGQVVYMCFYSIMRDPDYWPEPEKFDPERFRPENRHKIVPGSYCPFGIGPRTCIGYRFALAEAKLAIAKILCEFEYLPAPGTVFPPIGRVPTYIQNESVNLIVDFRQLKNPLN